MAIPSFADFASFKTWVDANYNVVEHTQTEPRFVEKQTAEARTRPADYRVLVESEGGDGIYVTFRLDIGPGTEIRVMTDPFDRKGRPWVSDNDAPFYERIAGQVGSYSHNFGSGSELLIWTELIREDHINNFVVVRSGWLLSAAIKEREIRVYNYGAGLRFATLDSEVPVAYTQRSI